MSTGVRRSTSSSRSKPTGASSVPNVRLTFDALFGVKLTRRLSISVSVVGSPPPSSESEVVSWPKTYRLSVSSRKRATATFPAAKELSLVLPS